jgi:group II intron reverse transcriptase/maturase
MQKFEVVLDVLKRKSSEENFQYKDLYRVLYIPEAYMKAYLKLSPNPGNMTEGIDNNTIDGFGKDRVTKLIEKIKDESYRPNPARRTYIPKKDGKKRPLGIPSFDDKLVQEIVRKILESIYEGTFSDFSHAYRPNRSSHTCLLQMKDTGKATKWWIEGDIKGFFDNIDHEVMIGILRKRIKDERFLNLIRKFLKAGYVEEWEFKNSYSGTPQGGVLSTILANIYLDQLDKYMEELKTRFDKGTLRTHHKRYMTNASMIRQRRKKRKNSEDEDYRNRLLQEIKSLEKINFSLPSKNPMDKDFKRIKYFRYADDFVVSIIGDKEDAERVKEEIKSFLKEKLQLKLSDEKSKITHNTKPIKFLGYEIVINQSQHLVDTAKGKVRQLSGNVVLRVPHEAFRSFLLKNEFMEITGNGTWKATHVKKFINNSDLEILRSFNAKIRGFYEYYSLANNIFNFHNPYWLVQQSFQRTLANKGKTNTKKIREKHIINGDLVVKYKDKKGNEKTAKLFNGPWKRKNEPSPSLTLDLEPNTLIYTGRNSLEDRIQASKCEWCGTEEGDFEVHHVRKIKDLKGKKTWEKVMISRNRKTMVLCTKCHVDLHLGKLD